MKRIAIPVLPVKSSNIQGVGYEPITQTLAVQFSSGKTYHYSGVDADTHSALIGADSIGSHFAKNIRSAFAGTVFDPEAE